MPIERVIGFLFLREFELRNEGKKAITPTYNIDINMSSKKNGVGIFFITSVLMIFALRSIFVITLSFLWLITMSKLRKLVLLKFLLQLNSHIV